MDKLLQLADPNGEPLICLEVNPPRGTDLESVFARLEGHLAGVDLLNVTDSALARMRCAPLPFAALLKQRFQLEVVVNLACRDRNLIAIQGDLLAAWPMGVRSIVALTGDAVTVGDSPERKGVFEINSIGLLSTIASLNSGKDVSGHELKGAPDFISGVVVNPNVKNMDAELRRLDRKRAAGAKYALSQPVYDEAQAVQFFEKAKNVGVPILAGMLAIKSHKGLEAINAVPGIRAPEYFISSVQALPSDDAISEFSLQHCLAIAHALRPLVRGFHVVTGATPKLALELVRRLVEWLKPGALDCRHPER